MTPRPPFPSPPLDGVAVGLRDLLLLLSVVDVVDVVVVADGMDK